MAAWTLLVLPIFAASEWIATTAQPAMLVSAGWSVNAIASVMLPANAVQVIAALATGIAITRLGSARSALGLGVLGVMVVLALFPLATGTARAIPMTLAIIAVAAVDGAKLTWIATGCMDFARPSVPATDYIVPMSIEGIWVTAIGSAGLAIAGAIGFPLFVAAAVCVAFLGATITPTWIQVQHLDAYSIRVEPMTKRSSAQRDSRSRGRPRGSSPSAPPSLSFVD